MDLSMLSWPGWRDVVLVLAALLGVYLVLAVMRLFQIGGKRRRPVALTPEAEPNAEDPLRVEPPPAATGGFGDELARSSLAGDVSRVQRECAALRDELARLNEEVSQLKAARNVSPLYNEAMALAQQGMPAAGIAGHCGISIGEAELVAALARNDSGFERQEEDEESDEQYTGPGIRA